MAARRGLDVSVSLPIFAPNVLSPAPIHSGSAEPRTSIKCMSEDFPFVAMIDKSSGGVKEFRHANHNRRSPEGILKVVFSPLGFRSCLVERNIKTYASGL